MLGTNDRYWPLEACSLYWDDLKGDKYLIYVPNNGHGLPDRARLVAGLNALNRSVMTGKPLPKLKWSFIEDGDSHKLKINSDTQITRLQLWSATPPTLDFRDSKWTTVREQSGAREFVIDLPRPTDAHVAYFGELIFNEGQDDQFSLSTNIKLMRNSAAAAGP